MKERPILFSGEMVRAILDGRKTQTRRVVKPQPTDEEGAPYEGRLIGPEWYEPEVVDRQGFYVIGKPIFGVHDPYGECGFKCPYQPEMKLWVRETFQVCKALNWDVLPVSSSPPPGVSTRAYKADAHTYQNIPTDFKWRPSIFMPRWASRIDLEVTAVRAERLKKLTVADLLAEGCRALDHEFIPLWNNLNAKRGYGWDANPWVWVVEFKRIDVSP